MRSTFALASIVVSLATVFARADTHAQAIGVFADASATSCDLSLPPGVPTNVYIVAVLGPQACTGITGAEFRVDGLPAGWFTIPVSAPPVPILPPGDPFGEGATLAFGTTCLASGTGVVLLMTVAIVPTTVVTDHYVTVAAHSSPSLPGFDCPLVLLCDPPAYSALCVDGRSALINKSFIPWCCQDACSFPTCPPIAVAPTTWARVKSLYATP